MSQPNPLPWMLTEEEADRVARDAFQQDMLLQHYVESRGHWERLLPFLILAQARKLVEWQFEPCSEHAYLRHAIRRYTVKRFQCGKCMEQLREEVGLE